MQLEWIEATPRDSEGERYRVHYLIDVLSEQCLAMIPDPREGHILWSTDLRVRGYDRSFVSLAAAKTYCECAAVRANFEEAREMDKEFATEKGGAEVPHLIETAGDEERGVK